MESLTESSLSLTNRNEHQLSWLDENRNAALSKKQFGINKDRLP